MKIISVDNLDKRNSIYMSTFLKEKFKIESLQGTCYDSVLNIVKSFNKVQRYIDYNTLDIAYGYFGNPSRRMFRHCFFIINETGIIDPVIIDRIEKDTQYHILKTFKLDEYINTINKFYSVKEKKLEEYPPTLEGFIDEERIYCEIAFNNRIYVDETDYERYLKKYDIGEKIIGVNKDILANILKYEDTVGKSIKLNTLLEYGDGNKVWIEFYIPTLAIKQGEDLITVNGDIVFKIANINYRIREYIEEVI